ncbi:MAG: type II toxin-antitoxin system RelE family toxin [Bryobacteraceae bacterium]
MVRHSLEIKQSAQKELDALNDTLFNRIDRKILALADNPRPAGSKKLRGYKDQWRIRIGDYRVIYTIDTATQTVTVTHVAHRREVYE